MAFVLRMSSLSKRIVSLYRYWRCAVFSYLGVPHELLPHELYVHAMGLSMAFGHLRFGAKWPISPGLIMAANIGLALTPAALLLCVSKRIGWTCGGKKTFLDIDGAYVVTSLWSIVAFLADGNPELQLLARVVLAVGLPATCAHLSLPLTSIGISRALFFGESSMLVATWGLPFLVTLRYIHFGRSDSEVGKINKGRVSCRSRSAEIERAVLNSASWKPPSFRKLFAWKQFRPTPKEELLAAFTCTVVMWMRPLGNSHFRCNRKLRRRRHRLTHTVRRGQLFLSSAHIGFSTSDVFGQRVRFFLAASRLNRFCLKRRDNIFSLTTQIQLRHKTFNSIDLRISAKGAAALTKLLAAHSDLQTRYDAGIDSLASLPDSSDSLQRRHVPFQSCLPEDELYRFFSLPGPLRHELSTCGFLPREQMNSIHEESIDGLDLDELAKVALADDWGPGCLICDYLSAQGCDLIEVGPWLGDQSHEIENCKLICKAREVSMRAPVPPSAFAPKSTRLNTTFRLSFEFTSEGHCVQLCMEACNVAVDVPYGDYFSVQERTWMIQQSESVLLKRECRSVFSKSTMFKSMVESSTITGQKKAVNSLAEVLRLRASSQDGASNLNTSDENAEEEDDDEFNEDNIACPDYLSRRMNIYDKVDVEVWELQRLPTLFHSEWHSPFLPHDGSASWRWCTKEYEKHPWVVGTRESVATDTEPPLEAPAGWQPAEEWRVVEPPGEAAEDKWQYAMDFYLPAARWGRSSYARHCRRRLWKCAFVHNENISGRILTLELWEMQRRTTLFHTNWRTPFLPHDGETRYRWVDMDYRKHPWCEEDQEFCTAADSPPIKIPVGWRMNEEDWSVAKNDDSHNCDEDGWQYAIDFYRGDARWGPSPSGLHCRRRLWRIELIEVPEDVHSYSGSFSHD